jgi:PTH1 family peptidyl-tRNA hydrolase
VVGLGNPGPRYANSRHNVGFRVLDALASRYAAGAVEERFNGYFAVARMDGQAVGLLSPQTFMNDSGRSVAAALAAHPELDPGEDLLVVYDDLDLPLGRLRLRPSGGTGGHNGLASVAERLDRRDFARLRFGIGRPAEGVGVVEHVLADFTPDEQTVLPESVASAADAIALAFESGVAAAMDRFNRAG